MTILDDMHAAAESIAAMRRRRTIFAPPEMVDTVRDCVATLGAAEFYTVEASPHCPPGKILVAANLLAGVDCRG